MWGETQVELPRRIETFVERRGLAPSTGDELRTLCLGAMEANVVVIDGAICSALEEEARARSQRDPRDWPVVACALAVAASIWTNDNDFLGVGVATWTTETLQLWLDRNPEP